MCFVRDAYGVVLLCFGFRTQGSGIPRFGFKYLPESTSDFAANGFSMVGEVPA
jgi:hypothetical protein